MLARFRAMEADLQERTDRLEELERREQANQVLVITHCCLPMPEPKTPVKMTCSVEFVHILAVYLFWP